MVSQFIDVAVLVVLTVGALFVPLWLGLAGAAKEVVAPVANPTWESLGQNAAQAAIGGQSPGVAANEAALGGAVLGTGLGAATGALIGAAAGNRPGTGAAIGAGSGLLLGTAVGSGNARQAGGAIQSRYDVVYTQCMAAKGNDVGGGPGYPGPAPYY